MALTFFLPHVLISLLFLQLFLVSSAKPLPSVFGPLTLFNHVQHYLDNGGQDFYRKALKLKPGVYYDPLQFYNREDMEQVPWSSTRLSSNLEILRALSVHVPGVDRQEEATLDSQSNTVSCIVGDSRVIVGDVSEFTIAYAPSTPESVKRPVEFAILQWANHFSSKVRIRICFSWATHLGESTLGAATSPYFVSGNASPILRKDASYTPSLASALHGEDVLRPEAFHIHMVLNSKVAWHLDITKLAPLNRFDMTTTVLHELTHGLFFSGTLKGYVAIREAEFSKNTPGRFDQFMKVEGLIPVARVCAENRTNLFNAVTNPTLRFVDVGSRANFGLYSPGLFKPGSSTYHFDNATLDDDCIRGEISRSSCSDLMTHQLNMGYTRRDIGETTFRVLRAMISRAIGAVGDATCDLPESPLHSGTAQENAVTAFTLPTWGIATVAVVAGVGAILVSGVVISSISARRRGGGEHS